MNRHLLPFVKEIISEIAPPENDDLVIIAKGLGLRKIVATLLKIYDGPTKLVLLVSRKSGEAGWREEWWREGKGTSSSPPPPSSFSFLPLRSTLLLTRKLDWENSYPPWEFADQVFGSSVSRCPGRRGQSSLALLLPSSLEAHFFRVLHPDALSITLEDSSRSLLGSSSSTCSQRTSQQR